MSLFGGKRRRSQSYSLEGFPPVPSPFLKLDVEPVSPGDEIRFCVHANDKYMASVKNRIKGKSDILIAPTQDEIKKMVEQTFKSWAEQESVDGRDILLDSTLSPTASKSLVQQVPSYTSVADELAKLAK